MSSGVAFSRWWCGAAVASCLLSCVQVALAQEKLDLAAMRKTNLASVDQQRLDAWAQQRVKQVLGSGTPLKDGAALFAEMNPHLQAADATASFRTGVVKALAAAFGAQYKPSTGGNPTPAPVGPVFVLTLMRNPDKQNPDSPEALACYRSALKDSTPGVRVAAAEGVLRSKIQPQDWDAFLPELQKLASSETDPTVLDRLYRIITMNGGPAVDRAVPVLFAVLDARFVRFETKGEFPMACDANTVSWLAQKFPQITNNQMKNEIIRRAARLLADAVHLYVTEASGREQKWQLERVVVIVEQQLKAIARGSGNQAQPDVTTAMTDGGAERKNKMRQEIDKWIGNEQAAGLLNAAPFSFERGLGIKRTAPSTAPAASGPAAG